MRARRIIKTERGETSSGRGWRVIEAEGRAKRALARSLIRAAGGKR
jgi:hypothetical protein